MYDKQRLQKIINHFHDYFDLEEEDFNWMVRMLLDLRADVERLKAELEKD